jgi:hypothetical protein
MAEMLAARQETARALEMMAQALGGFTRGGHGGNDENGGGAHGLERPCSYHDFLKTNPPTFTLTREPLDVEHWLRVMEQKFLLLDITEQLKVCFAAQQLLGTASAWWDTCNAMQPVDHHVTWPEFTTAFREYYIPAGLLNRKVTEFLELTQGNMSMLDYANKFNQLAQYAGTHVGTDTKKRDRFYRGLSCMLQEKLFTRHYQTFGALMDAAITMEGLLRDSYTKHKRKWSSSGPSRHPQAQKVQVVRRVPYQSTGGHPYRHQQQSHQATSTLYRAPV